MHAYAFGGLGPKYEDKVRRSTFTAQALKVANPPSFALILKRDRVLQDMHDWLVKKASTPKA